MPNLDLDRICILCGPPLPTPLPARSCMARFKQASRVVHPPPAAPAAQPGEVAVVLVEVPAVPAPPAAQPVEVSAAPAAQPVEVPVEVAAQPVELPYQPADPPGEVVSVPTAQPLDAVAASGTPCAASSRTQAKLAVRNKKKRSAEDLL